MQRQSTENYIDACWTRMQHGAVGGLCSSKPKYTNETSCYIILKKLEMTLGLFSKIVLMGLFGICYCRLCVIQTERKGVFVQFKGAIYYDKLK